MNSLTGNRDSSGDFGLQEITDHSMADANSDEIFDAIAETISSELKPRDQSGLSYTDHDLASSAVIQHGIATSAAQIASHSLGNDIVNDALFTASVPVMDEYILPDLHDHDQRFMSASIREMDQSLQPKKRKNKTNEEDDAPQTAKKAKVTTVRDPNAVSKVVPWETW